MIIVFLKYDRYETAYVHKAYDVPNITSRFNAERKYEVELNKRCRALAKEIGVKLMQGSCYYTAKGTPRDKYREWNKRFKELTSQFTMETYLENVLGAKQVKTITLYG